MGSWLQYELRAIEDAGPISSGAGVSLRDVIGGNGLMWAFCWRNKTDVVNLAQIGGFYGATALPVAVAVATQLVAFGYLEELEPGRFRVRGAERYLRIAKTRSDAGKKGGKATAAGGKSLGNLRSNAEANASVPPKQTGSNAEALPLSTEHRALINEQLPPYPPSQAKRGKSKKLTREEKKALARNVGAQPIGACARCQREGLLGGDPPLCSRCSDLWVAEVERRKRAGDSDPWANCVAWVERERAGPTLRVVDGGGGGAKVHTAADTSGAA